MQSALLRAVFVVPATSYATISGRQNAPSVSGPCQLHPRLSVSVAQHRVHRSQPTQKQRSPVICFAVPASVPESASDRAVTLKPLPRAVENVADDPSLHNPLQRLHRLGPGWMGVILEYEGVIVDDTSELHSKAWEALGQEEGKPRPLHWALKRAEGMKSEQVGTHHIKQPCCHLHFASTTLQSDHYT